VTPCRNAFGDNGERPGGKFRFLGIGMHLFSGFLGGSANFGQGDQWGYALAIAQGAIGPPGHCVPIGFRFIRVVSQPTLAVLLGLAFVFDTGGLGFTSDCVCFR
jgi:hypothetical protein